MSPNHLRLAVLRAILRCARHRRIVDHAALTVRVDCTRTDVQTALDALAADGLVIARRDDVRLTLAGLAVSVASIPRAAKTTHATRARAA